MTHPTPSAPAPRLAVATPEVRRAGVAMAEAATELRRVRPHHALDGLLTGMPGSASARAALGLASLWEDSFGDWRRACAGHAHALRTAAGDYDEVDGQVAAALRPPGEER